MKIHQLRSATLKITYGGCCFLTDPMLAPAGTYPPLPLEGIDHIPNPVTELPCTLEEALAGVEAVIVTHTHFDHFDQTAIQVLPKNMPIFVQDGVDKAELEGYGFTQVIALDSPVTYKGITLTKTPCIHGLSSHTEALYAALGFRPAEAACGVVFQSADEKTLYLAGDTVWFDGVLNTINTYNPSVIITNNCRAEGPLNCPIIMGLEDLEHVAKAAPAAKVIASHMGAVSHAKVTRQDIRDFMKLRSLTNILVPEDGEAYSF